MEHGTPDSLKLKSSISLYHPSGVQCKGSLRVGSFEGLLGDSWVVISRVISRVAIAITHIRGLITPLIYP